MFFNKGSTPIDKVEQEPKFNARVGNNSPELPGFGALVGGRSQSQCFFESHLGVPIAIN